MIQRTLSAACSNLAPVLSAEIGELLSDQGEEDAIRRRGSRLMPEKTNTLLYGLCARLAPIERCACDHKQTGMYVE